MKSRRALLKNISLLGLFTFIPTLLSARTLDDLEFTAANKRKTLIKKKFSIKKSFDYFDYDFIDDMGFGMLRVIDDFEMGFLAGTPVHPHKKIEILTIVLEGELYHQDNFGNSGLIKAGDYQIMSAGSGLKHAEINPSQMFKSKGLQIWISSTNKIGKAHYDTKKGSQFNLHNQFTPIVNRSGDNALKIEQNARILRGQFDTKQTLLHKIESSENGIYIFIIEGSVQFKDRVLTKGDGLGIAKLSQIELTIEANSDVLLFEVPKEGEF
jgi:quercetin 2,3-dioxygenase